MKRILKDKRLILFDGICPFCNKYILFLAKNDSKDIFRFMSFQSERIKDLPESIKCQININHYITIVNNNNVLKRSDAILSIFLGLGFPYNISIIAYIIPRILRDKIYIAIARNRYHLFGKIDYCSIIYEKAKKDNLIKKIIM